MSIGSRLKNWVWGLLGRESGTDVTTGNKCSICGTPVPDGDGECPLCGSTDLVPMDEPRNASSTWLDPDRAKQHSEPAPDESVSRLQRIRTEQVLSANEDAWHDTADGYEVRLSDETMVVGSKEEVARLLREDQ